MAALRSNVALILGLITCPVSVLTAVESDDDTRLNTLCREGHAPTRVKAPATCPTCDNRDYGTFVKGRDLGDGTYAIVEAEAIEKAVASESEQKTMPLTTHPAEDVTHRTLPGGKVYYLAPTPASGQNYPLMVELVKRHPEIALCTMWAPRTRTAMYRLGVLNDALTITALAWPDSVKEAPASDATVDERMLPLAEQFVEQLLEPFNPEQYKDRRTETLREFITKAEVVAAAEVETEDAPTPTADLLAALQAAVEPKRKRKRAPAKKTTKKAS